MKHSKQTPIPFAAAMNDKLCETVSNVVINALSEVPGDEPVMVEIFPDAARLMLKDAEADTPTDGALSGKQPLEGGRAFGVSEVEMQRALQRCIDADRPLRMMVVRSDRSGLKPPVIRSIKAAHGCSEGTSFL